jgi:UDP-N-acetylglucosamine 3-dehydrogenase
MKQLKLVAVCDTDKERAEQFADKFNCAAYSDYQEMLDKEEIDAVSIVVPTKFHKEVALDVIEQGKHVLVEKPIADTIENAKEIIHAAKKRNVKLMIGHIERFNPAVIKLKEIVKEGRIGNIISLIARRVGLFPPQMKDANVVIDLAVHDIDIMSYILDKKPELIAARSGKALISKRDDYAELFLNYAGVNGFVQVNWITPIKIRNLSITGTKGYAEMNYITQELLLYESNYVADLKDFEDVVKFSKPNKVEIGVDSSEPLKNELSAFVKCINENKESPVSGETGLEALRIAIEAIEKKII